MIEVRHRHCEGCEYCTFLIGSKYLETTEPLLGKAVGLLSLNRMRDCDNEEKRCWWMSPDRQVTFVVTDADYPKRKVQYAEDAQGFRMH